MTGTTETTRCPQCRALLPSVPGYMAWCGHCGWNLIAPPRPKPASRVEAVYEALGRRLGDRLGRELRSAERLEPRWTAARVGAYAIATGVHLLAFAFEYNASWSVVGLRRRRVLTLGLPLMVALAPAEQVALVAHELAHDRNGDASRTTVVGPAIDGLAELYGLIAPTGWGGHAELSDMGFLEPVVNGVLWILSKPVLWLLQLELLLLLRDMQRAEYLADALAAGVAGTDAAVALQEKLLLSDTTDAVVARHLQGRLAPGQLVDELRAALVAVPAREVERRHRVARLEGSRLDSTHPPTGMRIRMLEERPHVRPRVVMDLHRSAAIDAELRALSGPLEERMVDEARDSLYYDYE